MDKIEPQESEFKNVLVFLKRNFLRSLHEINPWPNIRIMHTNILQDILAGIVVAIIALPLALAFGVGSGLGAITGLYGAICGGIIGGIFGGSRIGVSGPTGPKMAQLAMIMVGYRLASGEPDLNVAFTMIFFSGIILVVIAFLGISRMIYFVPYSVVGGFMCGIGVIVMILEFDSFMGLPSPHTVMEGVHDIPRAIMNAHPDALAISIPTLAILFFWPRITKWIKVLKHVPSPLVALLLGTGIANFWHLPVNYISDIPTGLPELYWPDWSRFGELFWPSASLAGLAVFDSLLTCIVADNLTGEKHSSDRETFGQGLANCAAGLVGGLTTATATMRTVANLQAGGKTPLAAVVHGLVLLALVLGLGPYAEKIPLACLAAILFKVGIDILDYRILPILHRLPLTDMLVFWTVFVVTIVEDLLVAMGVGVLLAFVRFVYEVSRVYQPKICYLEEFSEQYLQELGEDHKKKIKVLEPAGPLFFGNVKELEQVYDESGAHEILIIKLRKVTMLDLSGAYALEDLIQKARNRGITVWLCNAPPQVMQVLRQVRVFDEFGYSDYFPVIGDALQKAKKILEIKNGLPRESEAMKT